MCPQILVKLAFKYKTIGEHKMKFYAIREPEYLTQVELDRLREAGYIVIIEGGDDEKSR